MRAIGAKAAKIALRILDADPGIAVELIFTLRPVLVELSSESTPFGTTDWMTIAAIQRPAIRQLTGRFESREQRHARLWLGQQSSRTGAIASSAEP